jgi:hypothetical protein
MTPGLPDMAAVGDAAAKITDPQTVVLYFLLVLIVWFMAERAIAGWRHGRTADKFASSAEKLSEVMKADALQVTVQLALVQRELSDARVERGRMMAHLEETRARLERLQ